LKDLFRQCALLRDKLHEVIIVSSGAIALGMKHLGFKMRPKRLVDLQSCAAVGQVYLMDMYNSIADGFGMVCAQILLTWDDFKERSRYINARNTLLNLCSKGIIPIVNENDTVSIEELKFGDNDRLSSLVATSVDASNLIMLTDVEGFLQKGKLVKYVEYIDEDLWKAALPTQINSRSGGMRTKLEAAKICQNAGIKVFICSAFVENIITGIVLEGEDAGTVFSPKKRMDSKKRWIAFSAKSSGRLFAAGGAKEALLHHNRSLLRPGIRDIEGEFSPGDIVDICDLEGKVFAKGKVNLSSHFLRRAKKVKKEVVHRNNLVLL